MPSSTKRLYSLGRGSPLRQLNPTLKALFEIDGRRVTDTLDVVHVSMRIAVFIPLRLIFSSSLFLASALWFLDVPGF